MQEKDNVLYVRFFGAFSVRWNGVQLVNGRESQFTQLLQLLLYSRENGLERALLIDELFHDRDIKDVTHSMHVLFYNFKKRLKESGLPDCTYIVEKSGRFYWTPEIPVIDDTDEFEAAYQKAATAPSPEEKLNACLTACELYRGEFLPSYGESLWLAQEARRYREMFRDCVNQAAAILIEEKRYERLQALGIQAASVQPYSDWEHITLKALLGLERYEEADQLYRETERHYLEELGVRPDTRMPELRQIMTTDRRRGMKELDAIQKYMSGKQGPKDGAYLCSYAVLEKIYHVMERLAERGGQSVSLMLCALEEADGITSEENSSFKEDVVQRLEQAICGSLRKSDIVCRCGKFRYLVLLVNTAQERCSAIQTRIDARFNTRETKSEIRYYIRKIN